MDAPAVQYARTSDGVNIAYTVAGSGRPYVEVPVATSHLQASLALRAWGGFLEQLAMRHCLIRLDGRGHGMSERDVSDLSLDARVRDLEAVTEQLGLEQVVLHGSIAGCHPVIRFAARHPDRVSHLVLLGPIRRGADTFGPDARGLGPALQAMAQVDYRFFAETLARGAGYTDLDEIAAFAETVQQAASPEQNRTLTEAWARSDVTEDLPRVACPTLVIGSERGPLPPVDLVQDVAARIPNSRLVLLRTMPWLDPTEALAAIDRFLAPVEPEPVAPRGAAGAAPSPFRTILFTDLESSTALTQRLGDAKAQEVLRGHNDAVRAALDAHGGQEVKHTGDGIMASFPSAVAAVEAALAMQRDLAGAEVRVRIGLNAGEPIAEDGDYFGTAVQLAARLCDRAEPGQVLVSDVVRQLCAGKNFTFDDVGAATLKGFDEPVALYAVVPR